MHILICSLRVYKDSKNYTMFVFPLAAMAIVWAISRLRGREMWWLFERNTLEKWSHFMANWSSSLEMQRSAEDAAQYARERDENPIASLQIGQLSDRKLQICTFFLFRSDKQWPTDESVAERRFSSWHGNIEAEFRRYDVLNVSICM